jgi:hypothetical protein
MERLNHIDYQKVEQEIEEPGSFKLDPVEKQAERITRALRSGFVISILGMQAGKIAAAFNRMLDTFGTPTDLHLGNMMRRGNTLVFTDPYSQAPSKFAPKNNHSLVTFSPWANSYSKDKSCECTACQYYKGKK